MSDELRDRIAEEIYRKLNCKYGDFNMPEDAAQAVIDALQIEEHQGRYILGWRPDDPDYKPF